jgi:putative acetyltransferase
MKQLVTSRLILRQYVEEDFNDFYDLGKSKKVGPMAGWKPHESEEESRKIFDSFIKGDEVYAIYHKEDKKVIGSFGIHPDSKRRIENVFALGYVLHEDYWGQGIIVEAGKEVIRHLFEDRCVKIITVYHYPFNKQSQRVIEKLGFKYEGTLRMATKIYDGTIHDDLCYSVLKSEYEQIK